MWMKIDDGLHAHRKTRAVTRSHECKDRDSSPMGLWVLAGSWSARNNRDGWVPLEELDRWDDDWEALTKRLIHAGYWWPEQRDGEDGYGFNDWQEWNNPDGASVSGTFGNHIRWHVNKAFVKPGCEHCPQEPDEAEEASDHRPESHPTRPDHRPDIAPDSGGESGGESLRDHRGDSLTQPDPNPSPTKNSRASADAERMAADFDAWYDAYPRKRGPGQALKAYKAARKKADAGTLAAAVVAQRAALVSRGMEYVPYPATWLNGERWQDQPDRSSAQVIEADDWRRRRPQ